jgi:hypothetical protein
MVDLGTPPIKALRAATSAENADLFGIAQRVGTLEKANSPTSPVTHHRHCRHRAGLLRDEEGKIAKNVSPDGRRNAAEGVAGISKSVERGPATTPASFRSFWQKIEFGAAKSCHPNNKTI